MVPGEVDQFVEPLRRVAGFFASSFAVMPLYVCGGTCESHRRFFEGPER
jgi:hypothetical protein